MTLYPPSAAPHYDPANEAQFRRQVIESIRAISEAEQASQPLIDSISLSFDQTTSTLTARVTAGRGTNSVRIQISDDPDFASPEVDTTEDLAEGETHEETHVITAAERARQWYARATAFSGAAGAGVEGQTAEDAVFPGRGFGFVREVPTEDQATLVATLTLIPIVGASFDEIHASTQEGNGAWTAWAPVTADGDGNYVDTVDLAEKHPSKIAYRVLVDGVIVQENVVTFDFGTVANILNFSVANNGAGTASITVNVDSDTETGLGGVQYSVDGGSAVDAVVGVDRTAVFDVTQTTSPQSVEMWAVSPEGNAGPSKFVEVELYDPPDPGPEVIAISAVTHVVISIDAGANDQHVVSVSTIGTVSSSSHALRIEIYAGSTLIHTEAAHDPESGPLIQVEPAEAPGTLYYARVRLYQLSDDAVVSDVTTIPVLRS